MRLWISHFMNCGSSSAPVIIGVLIIRLLTLKRLMLMLFLRRFSNSLCWGSWWDLGCSGLFIIQFIEHAFDGVCLWVAWTLFTYWVNQLRKRKCLLRKLIEEFVWTFDLESTIRPHQRRWLLLVVARSHHISLVIPADQLLLFWGLMSWEGSSVFVFHFWILGLICKPYWFANVLIVESSSASWQESDPFLGLL